MTVTEPLALALARAASRFVGESKVGKRRGSVTAVAAAMRERGVEISSNTLGRKLAGVYPLGSDELGALAEVIGVEPDVIWREAIRLMKEQAAADDRDLAPRTSWGADAIAQGEAEHARPEPDEDGDDGHGSATA